MTFGATGPKGLKRLLMRFIALWLHPWHLTTPVCARKQTNGPPVIDQHFFYRQLQLPPCTVRAVDPPTYPVPPFQNGLHQLIICGKIWRHQKTSPLGKNLIHVDMKTRSSNNENFSIIWHKTTSLIRNACCLTSHALCKGGFSHATTIELSLRNAVYQTAVR